MQRECFGEKGEQSSFSCFSKCIFLFSCSHKRTSHRAEGTSEAVRKKFKSNYLNMRSFIMIDFNTLSSQKGTKRDSWCTTFTPAATSMSILWCLISIYGFLFSKMLVHGWRKSFRWRNFYDHVELIERCNLMMREEKALELASVLELI